MAHSWTTLSLSARSPAPGRRAFHGKVLRRMQQPVPAKEARERLQQLERNIEQVIRGKNSVVRMAIIGLLAGGHVLFEDVPGVGKTTLAHCLAKSINLSFQRVQGTSDLLPSDILGVVVFDANRQEFSFRQGPIFTNILLVDEINRTSPKTQSALLEAMNTAQVSIERTTYELPHPFMVIATQNPLDSHGTFPLPKSQLDRFMMRLHLGYPSTEFEREILRNERAAGDFSMVRQVLSADEMSGMQQGARAVRIEDSLIDYIVQIIKATRHSPQIEVGCSTRSAIALRDCAKAHAYLNGRDFCLPDDIKAVAVSVMAHRLGLVRTYEEEADSVGEGASTVTAILEDLSVPI